MLFPRLVLSTYFMDPQLLESHGTCTPCELCVAARITSMVMLFSATEDQLKPQISNKGCNVKLAPGSCSAFHSASGCYQSETPITSISARLKLQNSRARILNSRQAESI